VLWDYLLCQRAVLLWRGLLSEWPGLLQHGQRLDLLCRRGELLWERHYHHLLCRRERLL
jgi:hypothetical protein